MRKILAAALGLGILLGLAGTATAATPEVPRQYSAATWTPAPVETPKKPPVVRPHAAAAPVGCRLSPNWFVTMSKVWNGNDFNYAVMNSPGPLRVGAAQPLPERSAFYTFRGSDRTWDGYFHNRDTTKPASYVYRTEAVPGDADQNIDSISVIAMAPSGIFCVKNFNR